jgi:hypothetical protein
LKNKTLTFAEQTSMKSRFLKYFIIFTFFVIKTTYAQNFEDTLTKKEPVVYKTELIVNSSIKSLVRKNVMINENSKGVPGYRIQLFSDSGNDAKDKANKVKSNFLAKYPDESTYLQYTEPNFKIRVGNFRTRLEAEKFFAELSPDFPYAFIVRDIVDFEKIAPKF